MAIASGWWQRPANPVYCNEHSSENTNSTTISAKELHCFVLDFLYLWVFCLRMCSTHHMRAVPIEVRWESWISLKWNYSHDGAGLNAGPLFQQQVLLIAGPSFQPLLWSFWARVLRGHRLWTHYRADIGFEVLILLPLPSQLMQAWATTSGLEEKF